MRLTYENVIWGVVLALLIVGIPNGYAQAYLDPGSGSFIIQLVAAGILGGMLSIRLFWKRIVGFFQGNRTTTEDVESNTVDTDTPKSS